MLGDVLPVATLDDEKDHVPTHAEHLGQSQLGHTSRKQPAYLDNLIGGEFRGVDHLSAHQSFRPRSRSIPVTGCSSADPRLRMHPGSAPVSTSNALRMHSRSAPISRCSATLCVSVLCVCDQIPSEKMIWANACWVVAMMKRAVFSKLFPSGKLIRESVSRRSDFGCDVKAAISSPVGSSGPNPTRSKMRHVRRDWSVLVDLGPKSLDMVRGKDVKRMHALGISAGCYPSALFLNRSDRLLVSKLASVNMLAAGAVGQDPVVDRPLPLPAPARHLANAEPEGVRGLQIDQVVRLGRGCYGGSIHRVTSGGSRARTLTRRGHTSLCTRSVAQPGRGARA